MEPTALTTYIRKAETSTDQETSIVRLLGMLSRGEIKKADIQVHYKRENLPTFNSYVQSFGRGELFASQRMDFGSWLDGKKYADDWELALNVKAMGELCGYTEGNSEAFYSLWKFVVKMVMLHPYQRKAKADFMGEGKLREAWSRRQIAEGWQNWNHA